MEKITTEMSELNIQMDKVYKTFNGLSNDKQIEVKEASPVFYNAIVSKNIMLLKSDMIEEFLEKYEPIFERIKTLDDFRMLSKDQKDLFQKKYPESFKQLTIFSIIENDIIELIQGLISFDYPANIYSNFKQLLDSAFASSMTQNPRISFQEYEITQLMNIAKLIFCIDQRAMNLSVVKIQNIIFDAAYFKDIIRCLVEISFYNFKYEKNIDISYIESIISFFMDLNDLIVNEQIKLK